MLLLPLLLATLATANPEQIFRAPEKKYNVLNPSLVREIDQIRQDWDIKGASVAVVRLKDGAWEQDTLGFGVADGAGNAVTEHVSRTPRHLRQRFPDTRIDPLRNRLEFETIHRHRSGTCRSQRDLWLYAENQNQGRRF
jgi:hypothetical protein